MRHLASAVSLIVIQADHQREDVFKRRTEHHTSGEIRLCLFAALGFFPVEAVKPPEFLRLFVGKYREWHGCPCASASASVSRWSLPLDYFAFRRQLEHDVHSQSRKLRMARRKYIECGWRYGDCHIVRFRSVPRLVSCNVHSHHYCGFKGFVRLIGRMIVAPVITVLICSGGDAHRRTISASYVARKPQASESESFASPFRLMPDKGHYQALTQGRGMCDEDEAFKAYEHSLRTRSVLDVEHER